MSIDGLHLARVTGTGPAELFATLKPRKGRPKNEPLKVAIALHEWMALEAARKTGESKRLARIRAARALSIGGDDDNAEKYIRTHAKHDTAMAAMSDYDRLMTWSGDATGDGRAALLLRRDASIHIAGDFLHMRGMVWRCEWGSREALCGSVDLRMTTDAPHLLAMLPASLKGGGINSP